MDFTPLKSQEFDVNSWIHQIFKSDQNPPEAADLEVCWFMHSIQ